jgi:uncharacterized membrane protein
VKQLGEKIFRVLYSAVALVSFLWMLRAYGAAPHVELWVAPPALTWLPVLVMPLAWYLVIAGVTTPNPGMVGLTDAVEEAASCRGVHTITRHPMLWGVALWALVHIPVNGDLASLVLMGGFLVLAFGGMWHIDYKRSQLIGGDYGPFLLTTSIVPFAAIATGRCKPDWLGIGIMRPLIALLLAAASFHLHEMIIGVSAIPN